MQKESLFKTKLAIIQLECPEFSESDLKILESEHQSGKRNKKRSFWKIDELGERVYQDIKNFSPHQIYYHHLFKLAERDGEIDRDTRLDLPSSTLTGDDYDYWCRMDFWHTYEFIGLLIGRSPNQIAQYVSEAGPTTTELAHQVLSLKVLLDRSYDMRKIDFRSAPQVLLAWAKGKQIDLPELLVASAGKFGLLDFDEDSQQTETQLQDQNVVQMPNTVQTKNAKPQLHTKERDSMSKLIIGMAVRGYSYDPAQKRSPIASEISDDLAACGISMDVDTARKYLKQSSEYLPRDFKPNSETPKPNSRTG